jgi:hypothetical protein
MKPDFGATSEDYARHRAGFPNSLFERLAEHGIGSRGQCIADLGTGTGTLARVSLAAAATSSGSTPLKRCFKPPERSTR